PSPGDPRTLAGAGAEDPLRSRRALRPGGAGGREAASGSPLMTEVAAAVDVAAAATELFIESVAGAAAARGRAAVALTGGSTAKPLPARVRSARPPLGAAPRL